MKTITCRTRTTNNYFLVAEPQGRRCVSKTTGSHWCEPEHREGLGFALSEAERITSSMTKPMMAELLTKLGATVWGGEDRSQLVTMTTNALIDLWYPEELV